jgi:deoxyribodipyrimidine photo-lyase
MPWKKDPESLERWRSGQTGFPIVDAGMRQLRQTGFMHNRVRMIVAMFLTKDLHLDWREGDRWFMQRLLDGEIASNNGGWQWSSGTGTDAAPYFRIQNPWTQGLRFDAAGEYIKRWVPELESVPGARLHQPPSPGLRLVSSYPLPMVDHAAERNISLASYKLHLSSSRSTIVG